MQHNIIINKQKSLLAINLFHDLVIEMRLLLPVNDSSVHYYQPLLLTINKTILLQLINSYKWCLIRGWYLPLLLF